MTDPQNTARVRLHGELNDFLPEASRGREVPAPVPDRPSVKDTIEALGVPHPEIALILIDGAPAPFEAQLDVGVMVEVHPAATAPALEEAPALRPPMPQPPRFITDVHLKKLARDLRLLGLDTFHAETIDDPEIADISAAEGRILLTRDLGLLKRRVVDFGRWVRNTDPELQIRELLSRWPLADHLAPFTCCLACSGPIVRIDRLEAEGQVPDTVWDQYDDFHRCESCARFFWPGSHYDRLERRAELLSAYAHKHRPRRW